MDAVKTSILKFKFDHCSITTCHHKLQNVYFIPLQQLIDCRVREERWQHTDLLQVIVLLCHFQSLSTFCLGTGINLELDHESGLTYEEKEAANNAMRSKETIEKRLSFIPLPEHAAVSFNRIFP